MTRRITILVLKYGAGLAVLAWVLSAHWHMAAPDGSDVGLAVMLDRRVRPLPLLAAAAAVVLSLSLTLTRWYILVRAQQLPFTPLSAVRLGLIGYAVSTFLPGSVGGDILKAALIAREQTRRTAAAATVLFDRVVGMTGLYSLAAGAGLVCEFTGVFRDLVPPGAPRAVIGGALTAAAGTVAGLVALWMLLCRFPESWSQALGVRLRRVPRLGAVLAECWGAARLYRTRPGAVAAAWALSVLHHSNLVLTIYLAAVSLAPPADVPPLAAHFLIVPIGSTVQAGAPVPGGVGVAEYGYGLLYEALGAAFAAGVLAALTVRALGWTVAFFGYLVYLVLPRSDYSSSSRSLASTE